MLFLDGYKGKEVATEMHMTPPAVTQRYNKMMHEAVIPYFKRYFVAADYAAELSIPPPIRRCSHRYATDDKCRRCRRLRAR